MAVGRGTDFAFFGLGSGVLIGLFNALLVVRLRIPDLLATLATMFFAGRLAVDSYRRPIDQQRLDVA